MFETEVHLCWVIYRIVSGEERWNRRAGLLAADLVLSMISGSLALCLRIGNTLYCFIVEKNA
jgi:hypothetical protein